MHFSIYMLLKVLKVYNSNIGYNLLVPLILALDDSKMY
jgi:hypothetical protein